MSNTGCPELEVLFTELSEGSGASLEHAKSCERCSEIVREHRELERELFRIADPFPSSSFVSQVMAKVAANPVSPYHEMKVGLGIMFGAFALALSALVLGGGVGQVGILAASAVVHAQTLVVGLSSAISVLWTTAASTMLLSLALVMFAALFMLKRLMPGAAQFSEVKISS
jgi:hypothetical protein